MRILFVLIIIIPLCGCNFGLPTKGDYLAVEDFIPHVTYEWKNNNGRSVNYYIASVEQLTQVKEPIKYVGTVDSHHLFIAIPKRPIASDEILNFAVQKNSCIVDLPKSPEEEDKSRHPRWIKIEEGKIVVEKSA